MKKEDYKAPIRGIAKMILKLLTQLATLFLNKIKDVEVRMMATGLLQSAEKTVDVLSDANPNDKEQIKAVVNQLFNEGPFKQGIREELLQKIEKLKNEHVRKALSIINTHTFPIADILTDENPDNTEQAKEHLIELLKSNDGMDLFHALLSIILPTSYADMLTILIIQSLLNWIEDKGDAENNSETVARLVSLQKEYQARMAA